MPGSDRMPWCDFCRVRDAIGWLVDDRGRREEPVCVEYWDELIERENAIAIAEAAAPGGGARLRELLPPLRIAAPLPMRRPLPANEAELDEHGEPVKRTKLERLADGWQAFVEESERRGRELDDAGGDA